MAPLCSSAQGGVAVSSVRLRKLTIAEAFIVDAVRTAGGRLTCRTRVEDGNPGRARWVGTYRGAGDCAARGRSTRGIISVISVISVISAAPEPLDAKCALIRKMRHARNHRHRSRP